VVRYPSQGRDIQEKIMGRGEVPLGIDVSAIETPLQDPDTGEWNRIGVNIVETPDFATRVDKQFEDLKARKTQGELKPTGEEGVFASDIEVELSAADIKMQAEAGVDDFLMANPLWGEHLKQQGVEPEGIRQATANFIEGRLRSRIQKDKTTKFVGTPKKEDVAVNNYDGWGIGNNINASIVRSNDTGRIITIQGQTLLDDEGNQEVDEYGTPRTVGTQEMGLSSENEFLIRQNNAARSPYKLLVSPQFMWNAENFGDPIVNVGEEYLELDKVQDFLVVNKDIPELGIRNGQPVPDEGIEQLIGLLEQGVTVEAVLKEIERGGFAEAMLGTKSKEVLQRIAKDPSIIKPGDVGREFFAVGKMKDEDGDLSVFVPYRFVKKVIKASTSTDGKGGFDINESDFFKQEEVLEDPLGIL